VAVIVAFAYVLSAGALDWGPARRSADQVPQPVLRASSWPGPGGQGGRPPSGAEGEAA